MSLTIPDKDWFKAPAGAERLWIGLALIWCFVMSMMMPYWHFRGKQNSRGEAYSVTPEAFMARTIAFAEEPRQWRSGGRTGYRRKNASCKNWKVK